MGKIKVYADPNTATEETIKFQMRAELKSVKVMCFGQDNPYLKIERAKLLYRKEFETVVKTKYNYDEKQPVWDQIELTLTELCHNIK